MQKLLLIFAAGILVVGCSQPVSQSSGTSSVSPATSLFGISLGSSVEAMVAKLGSPTTFSTSTGFAEYVYDYGILGKRVVTFVTSPTMEVVSIATSNPLDNVKGIRPGTSEAEVLKRIGTDYYKEEGTSYYTLNYVNLNIVVLISYATNEVQQIGVYNPAKVSFKPFSLILLRE